MAIDLAKGFMLPSDSPFTGPTEFCFVALNSSHVYHIASVIHGEPCVTACGTLDLHPKRSFRYSVSEVAPDNKNLCRGCAATRKVSGIYKKV